MERQQYRIELGSRAWPVDSGAEVLDPTDRDELPALMLAAYAGTTDDEGESLTEAIEEIDSWLTDGGLLDHSYGTRIDGRLISASLITLDELGPIVAYVITHPSAKGEGHGRRVVEASLNHLHYAGHAAVDLWITAGNRPSERLFASLGAKRVQ